MLIFLAVAVFPAAAMEITSELKEVINTDIVEDAVPDSAREIIGRAIFLLIPGAGALGDELDYSRIGAIS